MVLWFAGQHISLYQCLVENYSALTQCIYKFDHYLEMMLLDTVGESETVGGETVSVRFLQDVFPGKIVDYMSIRNNAGLTESDEYAIVCFPLKPKPHEIEEDWIRNYWHVN